MEARTDDSTNSVKPALSRVAYANVYRISVSNLGDRMSSPLNYFTFPHHFEPYHFKKPRHLFGNLIMGGGGFFWNPKRMQQYFDATEGHVITWGAGHNTHGERHVVWPAFMHRFALHGIRDWNAGFAWVPCASCMHVALSKEHVVEREVVLFEHHRFSTGIKTLRAMSNSENCFEKVIAFLGSAETVVTNSYHGAYWATLLGRKVVIVNPFSTKFYMYRHQPVIVEADDWRDGVRRAQAFQGALEECRVANREHHERVMHLLFRT